MSSPTARASRGPSGAGGPTISGSERRLVLLHGFTGSAASWGPEVLAALSGQGIEVQALDLPGHGARAGEVDAEHFTLDRVLELVRTALPESTAAGEGGRPPRAGRAARPALLGYSMGGRLALHCALAFPDRVGALVLESASPGIAAEAERRERRASDELLAERLESRGIEAFVEAWEALPLFASQSTLPEPRRAAQRRARLANRPESLAAALRGLGTGRLPSLWERLGEVEVPTLILAGALDPKFEAIGEHMALRMPGALLRVLPDAGHNVHLEQPEAWVRAVGSFLSESRVGY